MPAILMTRLHPRRRGAEAVALPPGPLFDWLKIKNPAAPAVKREAEEDWGQRERAIIEEAGDWEASIARSAIAVLFAISLAG